jgi:hypothetical protein
MIYNKAALQHFIIYCLKISSIKAAYFPAPVMARQKATKISGFLLLPVISTVIDSAYRYRHCCGGWDSLRGEISLHLIPTRMEQNSPRKIVSPKKKLALTLQEEINLTFLVSKMNKFIVAMRYHQPLQISSLTNGERACCTRLAKWWKENTRFT